MKGVMTSSNVELLDLVSDFIASDGSLGQLLLVLRFAGRVESPFLVPGETASRTRTALLLSVGVECRFGRCSRSVVLQVVVMFEFVGSAVTQADRFGDA